MCDKIRNDDERLNLVIIKNDPCINNENKELENCLKSNNNDWTKCKLEIKALKDCFERKDLRLKEEKLK